MPLVVSSYPPQRVGPMASRRWVPLALLMLSLCALSTQSSAQETSGVIRINVDLVQVDAIVNVLQLIPYRQKSARHLRHPRPAVSFHDGGMFRNETKAAKKVTCPLLREKPADYSAGFFCRAPSLRKSNGAVPGKYDQNPQCRP
jgi:hypothetical protein